MDQNLQTALTYWESKLAGRKMPARRDFDPVIEVPTLLPWVILVDVFHDPLNFRYRLIGAGVRDRSRQNYSGKLFSELSHVGPDSNNWKQRAEVVKTGAPLMCEPPYVGGSPGVDRVVVIHLPLSEDDQVVNMIFTVTSYHSSHERAEPAWKF